MSEVCLIIDVVGNKEARKKIKKFDEMLDIYPQLCHNRFTTKVVNKTNR